MNNQLEMKIITPENCQSFENCRAALCPLDKSFTKSVWYPDEPICGKRELSTEIRRIIRKQRKIARVSINRVKYFLLADLEAIQRVTKATGQTQGHDSDTDSLIRHVK